MRGMDNIPHEQKELLSAEDVAYYLGVGQMTVYRWCREGRLRRTKLGKHRGASVGRYSRSFSDSASGRPQSVVLLPDDPSYVDLGEHRTARGTCRGTPPPICPRTHAPPHT